MVKRLEGLRNRYEFWLHGVGLSLGSADGLDERHLRRVAEQVSCYQPVMVSEHLSWSRVGGVSLPDLLPLPLTEEALAIIVANVTRVQETLKRPIAIENGTAYARWRRDEMREWEFLRELVQRTGCLLLVDINNLHVNQLNLNEDPEEFIRGIPAHAVVEVHLAGPLETAGGWVDTHSTPVPEAVWQLYGRALEHLGATATAIERDQDLPPLQELIAEAERAQKMLAAVEEGERE